MKTALAGQQSGYKQKTRCYSNRSNGEVEEEPPGECQLTDQTDEPPGTGATIRNTLFGSVTDRQWTDWKWQFRSRITTIDELSYFIPFSLKEQAQLKLVSLRYPISITPYYLSLIDTNNPGDPIRRQAVPSPLEITMSSMGVEDPLDEKGDSVVPGLVHRYPDRVLYTQKGVASRQLDTHSGRDCSHAGLHPRP